MTHQDQTPEEDPRLVAYVLGGLDDAERAEVEAWIASDAEARRMVDELRQVAGQLEAELADEPAVGLHDGQRQAIVAAESQATGGPRLWPGFVALAAAALVFACVGWGDQWFGGDPDPSDDVATSEERAAADKQVPADGHPNPDRDELDLVAADDRIRDARSAPATNDHAPVEAAGGLLPDHSDRAFELEGRLQGDFSPEQANGAVVLERLRSLDREASDAGGEYRGPGDNVPPPRSVTELMRREAEGYLAGERAGGGGGGEDQDGFGVLLDQGEEARELSDDQRAELLAMGYLEGVDIPNEAGSTLRGLQGQPAGSPVMDPQHRPVPMTERVGAIEEAEELEEELQSAINEDAVLLEAPRNEAPSEKGLDAKSKSNVPTTWKRAAATPNASQLMIGDHDGLPLRGMQAQVQVDGFRARVVLDCLYVNDRDQQYEGTFKLRLPNGASPWFFAFGESVTKAPEGVLLGDHFYSAEQAREMGIAPADLMSDRRELWKQPKEARMVPKEKAARAYHETVRQRIDPALMEWSGAGVFSARVFPLTPRSVHRIVVGYDVDLERSGTALTYRLDLPEADVPVHVDIQVSKVPGLDFTLEPAAEFRDTDSGQQYHFEQTTERAFVLHGAAEGAVALTGSDEELGTFFAASCTAPLSEEDPTAGSSRAVFVVDTSLSSSPDLFNVWARLLPEVLERNDGALEEFAVLFFDVSSAWWQDGFVPNDAEHRDAVRRALDEVALEGATDLASALRRASTPDWADDQGAFDLFLLSDGAATWGETEHLALARALEGGAAQSLYAYRSGFAGTDVAALEALVRGQGGGVFAVLSEDEVAAAAVAHRQAPWQLERIEVPGVSDVLVAGRPSSLYPGQTLMVSGRGALESGAPMLVHLVRGDQRRTEPVALLEPLASDLATRAYGEVAVRHLEAFSEVTEETSKAYATHFRITGQTCSLLMLESEEEYERYDIRPEEDAFVVKRREVGETVEKALADFGETLGDPRRRFVTFLERLTTMPGMNFEIPASLRLAIEELPRESFEVHVAPLEVQQRTFEGVPGALEELLATRRVDYDLLVADAERRLTELSSADALRAVSSLVELNPRDPVVLRDVAFSAMEWGLGPTAYHLLRRVAESRPYEPQTYWNLGVCLEQMERADLALLWYEVALHGTWDGRFGEYRRIVAVDFLRFLRRIESGELTTQLPDYVRSRMKTVRDEVGFDEAALVITLQWNTDRTDVDTHVIEPSGEECYYSHRDTRTGGHLTQDVTQGYGPEMYTLPNAVKGDFKVLAHYFASDNNRSGVRTKVYATIYRDWGRETETVTRDVLTLERGKQKHAIQTVTFK